MALRNINIHYAESFADRMSNGEVFHAVDRSFLNTHFMPIVRKELVSNYIFSGSEFILLQLEREEIIKNIIRSTFLMKELENFLKAC